MSIVDMCISFVIGLLSVAYPILLQVIATLDEKYSSVVIVELFKKEREYRFFKILLVVTLVLIGCYGIANLSVTINILINSLPGLSLIIVCGLFLSTTLLITSFLLFISKILTYYTPSRIVNYFICKKEDRNYEYFNALGDILYFSIEKKLDGVALLIHEYYYKAFSDYRLKNSNEPVVYPDPYYALVLNIVSRLAPVSNPNFRFLEHRTVGGVWLIGEMKQIEISERTYGCLWRILTIAVQFERDDMVMLFWSNAHQHLVYHLSWITKEYENNGGESIIRNQEAVQKRDIERERFIEFTFALGGLLLFKNRLRCIKRMFRYTSSTPPSYDLLPLHMTQVFRSFFKFWDPHDEHFPFMGSKYWYPDTEGIGSEDLVKVWTCKYIAILFLRQYSIVKYYTYVEPVQLPQLPDKKTSRRIWIDHVDHFKRLIGEQYSNKELLDAVGLSFLTETWLHDQKKTGPLELVEQVKAKVIQAYERTEVEQEVSPLEVVKLKETTVMIIEKAFHEYDNLFDKKIVRNFTGYRSLGVRNLMDKSAFVADKEADYSNHYSVIAESVADNLEELVSGTFSIQSNQTFQVSEDDLFAAIDKLRPNPTKFVLINFGYNLDYWISANKYPGLTKDNYKNVPLYNFPNKNIDSRIYIMHRDELPYLFTKKPNAKEIKKYDLEAIGDHDIYFSILDLYRNKSVREEWLKSVDIGEVTKADIEKKVQIYTVTNAVLRWKKGVKLTALAITYPYMNREVIPQNLDEITPLEQ
jgi:hypothetical protein